MTRTDRNYPRRPPRIHLWAKTEPFYFVTFNTHVRKPILSCPEVQHAFLAFCTKAGDRGIAVGRYVIMPDHLHLFVRLPPYGMTLARWVQALRSVVGKTLLTMGHNKPHWQDGFFDHVLRNHESYSEKAHYVSMNPVRAGLAEHAEDWPYQGVVTQIRW